MPTQISRNRGVFQTFMVNSPSPKRLLSSKSVGFTDKNYSKDRVSLWPEQLAPMLSSFGPRLLRRGSGCLLRRWRRLDHAGWVHAAKVQAHHFNREHVDRR